jgi:diguanylate cyclase (GGDEF)-like protein
MVRNVLYGLAVAGVGVALDRVAALEPGWDEAVHVGYLVVVAGLVAWLRAALEQARALARTDALTGAPNRRTFLEAAERQLQRMRRDGRPFTVVYIDVDRFKQINDQHGHAAGDRVLRGVARALSGAIRAGDTYARIGGDEFALLLEGDRPGAPLGRLRAHLKKAMAAREWDVSFSIGAVTFRTAPASAEDVLRRSDEAMYAAKGDGDRMVHQIA